MQKQQQQKATKATMTTITKATMEIMAGSFYYIFYSGFFCISVTHLSYCKLVLSLVLTPDLCLKLLCRM